MPNTVGEYMGLKKKKNGSWSKSGDPMRTRATTDDYREGMERMGMGSALDRYCPGCGRLPAWCECGGLVKVMRDLHASAVDCVAKRCNALGVPAEFAAEAFGDEVSERMAKP
jgi:hypothetical protein